MLAAYLEMAALVLQNAVFVRSLCISGARICIIYLHLYIDHKLSRLKLLDVQEHNSIALHAGLRRIKNDILYQYID